MHTRITFIKVKPEESLLLRRHYNMGDKTIQYSISSNRIKGDIYVSVFLYCLILDDKNIRYDSFIMY